MFGDLNKKQTDLYKKLEGAIKEKKQIDQILQSASADNLRAVLSAADTTKEFTSTKRTETLLAFAISRINHEAIKAILDAAAKEKDILEKILTTTNITREFKGNRENTFTPLGWALSFYDWQESTKTILDTAAKEKDILEKVLTTTNITREFKGNRESTFTPLGFAIYTNDQERIEAILNAIEDKEILKEVFAGIEKDDREKIKGLLKEAGNQDMLNKIDQVEKIIENEAVGGNSRVLVSEPAGEGAMLSLTSENGDNSTVNQDSINKPIIIGIAFSAIATLAVGVGCFAAGVQLPILAIAGIVVAAASLVGLIAGGITYAVSKPNGKLGNPNLEWVDNNQVML
ncbi:MAG: hypothetical protein LBU56_00350 [Rickettsiales bacterium]|jgi:hypothetical protein|nr:hypothetical protein [Rickettsiales bacterium]